ncbi:Cation transport protein chaC [Labilithrix luteola]|uniref:glutathione-specific gamma-glutamylcyclotransferase n=1 Tax=Labilithrix luteola TaxID=1391654 RepID=A0A0K1QAV4_9BACT|nr:gamma-glutamylcyclotransferase [Labilithrix luteola]AKV02869.1 Cation transport protein chaC [Labilithrix luteola]
MGGRFPMWIFAYGSLIFRPAFPYLERKRAFLPGWSRRFWQGSPDHRGVPEAPGLVATLVAEAGAMCGGCAYRIDTTEAPRILAELDVREQAGFERHCFALFEEPDGVSFAEAVVYVAKTDNPHFLGPLDEKAIASWVRTRRGPSGANIDYVLCLHDALQALAIDDPHVDTIVRWLREEVIESTSS